MSRLDNRSPDQLRPFEFQRQFLSAAPGSVLISTGKTRVLCTASIDAGVPPWMAGKGKGWVTAEYSMLPGSTRPRKPRERSKVDGRTTEIQRLIGRSLRAIIDLDALGEYTLTVDCDVLYADGGTRTASITGAMLAIVDALRSIPELEAARKRPLKDLVAATSVGIIEGQPMLDLAYTEDVRAEVDMNVVMTGQGNFVEVQGTGEESTFTEPQLHELLGLAKQGIRQLVAAQRATLGTAWPLHDQGTP